MSFQDQFYLPQLKNPFKSFWMAGYECTDKLNAFGDRVDFLNLTAHYQLIEQDYKQLSTYNITTVREGIRWSQIEKRPYQYNFTIVEEMIAQGKISGIQQIWDICHFGFPDDLTPLHPKFAHRFASLCRAFADFYRTQDPDNTLIVTPINEVSFLSWLGGDARGTSPYCVGQGWEVKYSLMRAYIEGIAALKEVDPSIRILTTEPLVNIVPPLDATDEQLEEAKIQHELQYQSIDMLCGKICPELGGKDEYLDILGLNYYYNNQWVIGYQQFLPWLNENPDPRWRPLSSLLTEYYQRYNKPIALTETSHSGQDRDIWIEFIAQQAVEVVQKGIPFWGICLYPIIDRQDWDHLHYWHNSGLWDAELNENNLPARVLYKPYAQALLESQQLTAAAIKKASQQSILNYL